MALRVLYLACRVQHEYLAAYITELALPEYSALQWLPSIIAAAAVLLARHICAINIPIMRSLQPWSPTLQHYSGYRCALTCSHVYIRNVRLPPRSHTLQHHCGSKCSSRSTAQASAHMPHCAGVSRSSPSGPLARVAQDAQHSGAYWWQLHVRCPPPSAGVRLMAEIQCTC